MRNTELMVLSRGYSVETGIAYVRVGFLSSIGGKWRREELGYAEVPCATPSDMEVALAKAEEIAFAEARKRVEEEGE